MKIVSLDPGGTTGVVIAELWFPLKPEEQKSFKPQQIGPAEHHDILYNVLLDAKPDVIIYERFQFSQKTKVNTQALEYIGIAKLYETWRSRGDLCKLVPQTRGQKALWNDDKLKVVNLFMPGKQHANDAMRHLLYYITVTMKDEYFVRALEI